MGRSSSQLRSFPPCQPSQQRPASSPSHPTTRCHILKGPPHHAAHFSHRLVAAAPRLRAHLTHALLAAHSGLGGGNCSNSADSIGANGAAAGGDMRGIGGGGAAAARRGASALAPPEGLLPEFPAQLLEVGGAKGSAPAYWGRGGGGISAFGLHI
jgi:hypothetical protein